MAAWKRGGVLGGKGSAKGPTARGGETEGKAPREEPDAAGWDAAGVAGGEPGDSGESGEPDGLPGARGSHEAHEAGLHPARAAGATAPGGDSEWDEWARNLAPASQLHPAELHNPHAADHAEANPRVRRSSSLIWFDDFCFAYEDRPILRHVNLEIDEGDSVVLIGDNGSGKSTLLKAINGLVFPQRGAYYFDRQRVDAASMKDPAFAKRLHQRVGFIFQNSDAQLFCSSVEDEIAFGPRQMGLPDDQVRRRVQDVLGLLGIEALRSRAPYNLSGGEQKKVAIACILSMSPDVYCFDEPLNGLDVRTREWLLGFLKQLKRSGKTLIISTHDRSLADALADYFIFVGEQHEYTDRPHVHINV